jgi:hypothetical protein
MKIQYKNIVAKTMEDLCSKVNLSISDGFTPIGGLSFIKLGDTLNYIQSVYCDNPDNEKLEVFIDPLVNAKRLKGEGKSLEAVKLVMSIYNIGLVEAKDIVDAMV